MQMIDPIGSDRYIVTRNFATLHEGTDKKLWGELDLRERRSTGVCS